MHVRKDIIQEYLYIDEKMLDGYAKVTEEYDRLEEEERSETKTLESHCRT